MSEQPIGRRWTRARAWLDQHDARDRSPTPLLVARLAARRRAELIGGGTAVAMVLTYFGWLLWRDLADGSTAATTDTATQVASLAAGFAVLAAGAITALWLQRRADRQIGRGLRQRVALSTAQDPGTVLGGWFFAAAAVLYGGGAALGVAATGLAPEPTDRAMSAIFLASVLVYAALAAVMLVDVLRRPAIANDQPSLIEDAALRREDAHRALVPYPALLALVAGVGSRSGDLLMLAYLGYAFVTAIGWAVATRLAPHRVPRPKAAHR